MFIDHKIATNPRDRAPIAAALTLIAPSAAPENLTFYVDIEPPPAKGMQLVSINLFELVEGVAVPAGVFEIVNDGSTPVLP